MMDKSDFTNSNKTSEPSNVDILSQILVMEADINTLSNNRKRLSVWQKQIDEAQERNCVSPKKYDYVLSADGEDEYQEKNKLPSKNIKNAANKT